MVSPRLVYRGSFKRNERRGERREEERKGKEAVPLTSTLSVVGVLDSQVRIFVIDKIIKVFSLLMMSVG